MPTYRLCTLDPDLQVVATYDQEFGDDQDAIAMLRKAWAAGQRAEVWHGPRRLRPFTFMDGKVLGNRLSGEPGRGPTG